MAHIACELMTELESMIKKPMVMFCDNQAATYIASNPMFHDHTKQLEVDFHFIWEGFKLYLCEGSAKDKSILDYLHLSCNLALCIKDEDVHYIFLSLYLFSWKN